MAVNNVGFSQFEIVSYTKLNQLSQDATNTTDNIHPQYALQTDFNNTFVRKAGDTMTGTLTAPSFIAAAGGTGYGVKFFAEGNTLDFIFPNTTELTFEYLPSSDEIEVTTNNSGILKFKNDLKIIKGSLKLRNQDAIQAHLVAETGTTIRVDEGGRLYLWDIGTNSSRYLVLNNGVISAV